MTSTSLPARTLTACAFALAVAVSACGSDDASLADEIDSAVNAVSTFVDDAARDATEFATRNFATVQAQEEFESAGFTIVNELTCVADAETLDSIEITCTGMVEGDRVAQLRGTVEEFPGSSITELEGEFVGTVDDNEVFRVDTLGG